MTISIAKTMIGKNISGRLSSRAGIRFLIFMLVLTLTGCYPAPVRVIPQSPSAGTTGSVRAPMTQVYFYPKAGQSTEQQSRDYYECYNWAIKQTGFDPGLTSLPPEQRIKVVPTPPPGHDTVTLSIVGAVLGALIAGPRHAAGGALIGAGSGAVAGAVSDATRQQHAQQMEEAYSNRDRALDAQYEGRALNFRRAMSACLEGRGYTVQ
jgi:hypothetical protein